MQMIHVELLHLLAAKATCGHEIDPSEGRQLRKRPDPPKVEKKTPARKPHAVNNRKIILLP